MSVLVQDGMQYDSSILLKGQKGCRQSFKVLYHKALDFFTLNYKNHKNGITSCDNFQCRSRQKLRAVVSPHAASVSTYCASNDISTNRLKVKPSSYFQKLARAASIICSYLNHLFKYGAYSWNCYF